GAWAWSLLHRGPWPRASASAPVRPRLAAAFELDPQDEGWRLLRSRAHRTGHASPPVDTLAVYLRAGEQYFLPVQEGDETVRLVPVPSVDAWEQLIHVLPGMDEVQRPSS